MVDEERVNAERQILLLERQIRLPQGIPDTTPGAREPWEEITDTDECPECHTPYLNRISGSQYECPGCGQIFTLKEG